MIRRLQLSPLAFYAVAYGGSAAAQKGVGFVVFLWLAHSLSVADYATFGLLFALQTGLATLGVAGIVESVIGLLAKYEKPAARRELFNAANALLAVFSGAGAVLVLLIVPFTGAATPQMLPLLGVAALGGVLSAFFTLQSSLFRLEERHRPALLVGFLGPLAGFAGGAAGFLYGHGVASFFLGSAIGLVVALAGIFVLTGGLPGFALRSPAARAILAGIAPFVLIAVLGWLGGYGNTYLVKAFFNAEQVARFTFAYTLSSILQLVATALNQVWSPRFFKLVQTLDREEMERRNRRFSLLQGVALGLVGAAVLLVMEPGLRLMGGNLTAYRGLHWELFLLFAAYIVSIPWWHAQNYYYAFQKGAQLMAMTLAGSLAGLVTWIAAIWFLGLTGVYLGFMFQMLMRMITAVAWARREWRIWIQWEGPAIGLALLGIGAAAATFFPQ